MCLVPPLVQLRRGTVLLASCLLLCACGETDSAFSPSAGGMPVARAEHRLVNVQTGSPLPAGVRLLSRLRAGAWLAVGPIGALDAIGGRGVPIAQKLGAQLRASLGGRSEISEIDVWVIVSPAVDQAAILERLLRIDPRARRVGFAPIYALSAPATTARSLAELDAVLFVDRAPGRAIPALDVALRAVAADTVQSIDTSALPPRYHLSGRGTVAGIWDPGGIEAEHGDLEGRLLRYPRVDVAPSLEHGTWVAGALAGSGARSAAAPLHPYESFQLRGVAPSALIAAYLSDGDIDDAGSPSTFLTQYLEARARYGIDVVNLSFSTPSKATYDPSAYNLDYLLAGQDTSLPAAVPVVVSASNDGRELGYGSVASIAAAKDVISVGATDVLTGGLAALSSLGPTEDGRIKPELMAPGDATHAATAVAIDAVRLIPREGEPVSFTFDAGTEGWFADHHLQDLRADGGELRMTTSGGDPALISPDGLELDASRYTRVEVTMRAAKHKRAILFWRTNSADWSFAQHRFFLINGDGANRTYAIDLASQPLWQGTIRQIRLNPVLPGIMVAGPNDTYTTTEGTSISAPIVSGGLLLLLEAWREALPAAPGPPTPALYKALLVATAKDLVGEGPVGNPDLDGASTPYAAGPDYATGFGQVDIAAAVRLVERAAKGGPRAFSEAKLEREGQSLAFPFELDEGRERLVIALAWDDPASLPGEAVLQNDLDLTLVEPGGATLLPWTLDPDRPSDAATRGVDRRNNVEQLTVEAPKPGAYLVRVRAQALLSAQRFAIALSRPLKLGAARLDPGEGEDPPDPPSDSGVGQGGDERASTDDRGSANKGCSVDAAPASPSLGYLLILTFCAFRGASAGRARRWR